MGTFDLKFQARSTTANPEAIRARSEELGTLQSRLLGRADDLKADFNSSATQFTDLIGWNIKDIAEEDHQQWKDAGVAISYAASQLEVWAQYVDDFKTERSEQTSEWFEFRTSKESEIPGKYQDSTITESYPERGGLPFSDERKCRDLYADVADKLDDLNERERTNYKNFEDNAEDIADKLREGPTKENVQDLIDAGVNSWAFYNLDPNHYTMLVDGRELTAENAEEWAGELEAYWSGEKPLDDRYHQLMLMMSMINSNAMQAQQGGTGYRSEEIDFLREFYDTLEGEDPNSAGVLGIPEEMEDGNLDTEEREHALGMLGNGILALSDENLGGSYEDLPLSVRRAAEGPQFYEPGDDEVPYSWPLYANDAPALADMFRHTNEDLQGGYELSVNLSMSTGSYTHSIDESDLLASEDLTPLIDVGARNEDANYYVLTGEHPNTDPYADHPALGTDGSDSGVDYSELGVNFTDDERENVVEGLFTYEWEDDGAAVGGLIDWLATDIQSENEGDVIRAGDAFAGFMEMVTGDEMYEALTETGVKVTEGENEYTNATFTQFNGQLADSLADIFDAHIYSFANGEVVDGNDVPNSGIGEFEADRSFVEMGPDERARYMQLLMGDDETAGRIVNSVDAYQQVESVAYLETGNPASAARGSAQLQGLLEHSLWLESESREDDLGDTVDRKEQIAGFVMSEAGDLSKKIPVIGTAVSKGIGLGEESIVNAVIDGDYDVSPRFPVYTSDQSTERTFQMETLDFLAQKGPQEFEEDTQRGDFRTLVDSGVVSIERDGQTLKASDIPNDFTFDDNVTVSVAKETDWSEFDGPRRASIDDALSGIMGTTHISAEYVDGLGHTVNRDGPGDSWVEGFTGEYSKTYDRTRDYFNGDVEGFRN